MTTGVSGLSLSQRIALASIWLIVVTLPLFPYYYTPALTIDATDFPVLKIFPGLLAIVAVAPLVWPLKTGILGKLRDHWPLALYGAIGICSLADAPYPALGGARWCYFLISGGALYLSVLTLLNSKRLAVKMATVIGAVASCVAMIGLLEAASGTTPLFASWYQKFNPYSNPERLLSSVGNPVALGTYLACAFPITLGLMAQRKGVNRGVWLVAAAMQVAAIFLTASRLAITAALITGAVMLIHADVRASLRASRHRWLTIVVAVLMCLPVGRLIAGEFGAYSRVTVWDRLGELERRLTGTALRDAGSISFRIDQYEAVGRVLSKHPLLGVGFGNYTSVFDEYADPKWRGGLVRTTDNMYLLILAETGGLGFIAFIVLAVHVVRRVFLLRSSEDLLVAGFRASIIIFLLCFLVWDVLNHPLLRTVFWISAGVGDALSRGMAHSA